MDGTRPIIIIKKKAATPGIMEAPGRWPMPISSPP